MHGVERFGLLLSMFRGLRVSQSVCLSVGHDHELC